MADSILRLKVESQEYDQKIKRAAEGIQQYAQKCREAGGTLQYLNDGVLEFVQSLGKMDTVSTGTKQQLREISNALTTLTQTYRGLTDEEKASPFGQELAKGIQQLTERAGQAKDAMMDVEQSIKNAASDTRMFDQLAQGMGVAMAGFQGLTGAGKLLGIEMGNDVEVIAKLQAAMAVTNSLTTIQTALQKQSALMQGIQAAQAAAAAAAQGSLASATGVATVAQKAFNMVAKANPYMLLATAIAAVGSALWAFSSASSEAKKKEEELEKAMEEATKKAQEQRDTFVNASASAMNTASRLSSLQVAYMNANSEMEKTSILKEAQKEFKNLGIECKGLVDAQNLLVNQGGQIIEMIRLQGDAAAIAALRMEAFKKSFSMLLENGWEANGAAILAGYNAQVQDLDGLLTKIQTRIQTIKGGLPTSGGDGGKSGTTITPPPVAGSIDEQTKKVQELQKAWRAAADDDSRLKIKKEIEEQQYILDRMTGKETFDPSKLNILPDVDAQTAKVEELRQAWEAVANDDSRQKIKRELEDAQAELDRMTASVKSLKGVSIVPEIKLEDPLKRAKETLKTTRVEIEAEIKADATKVDTATLHTLIKDSIQSGIDDGLMNMIFASIGDQVARGINVPDEAWQKILDQYNALREQIGMEPISLDFKTGNLKGGKKDKEEKEEKKYLADGFAKITSGISGMASGFEALGIDLGKDFKEVIGGIQSITSILTAISTIVSAIEVIAGADALIPLAGGGIVRAASGTIVGNSYSGDNLRGISSGGQLYGLNAGEVVLNRAQVGNLASQLTGTGLNNLKLETYVDGRALRVVLNNESQGRLKGKYVTSNKR